VYTYRLKYSKQGEGKSKFELITKEKFEEYKAKRINDIPVIRKRKYFLLDRGSYHIDQFVNAGGHSILYADYTRDLAILEKFPAGIVIDKDVTNEVEYHASSLKPTK